MTRTDWTSASARPRAVSRMLASIDKTSPLRLPFHEREERVAVETELEAPGRPEAFEGLHGRKCCWQTRRAAPHEVSATPERTFVVEADPGLLTRRCDCDVVDGPRSVAGDRRRAVVRDHGSVPTRGERDGVAIDSVLEADGSGAGL